ncbi:MAG: outer membrane protein [Bacteroidia bacterium]|jgi:outer membrane protein
MLAICALFAKSVQAQNEVLTLEISIQEVLANNFDGQLAKIDLEISQNNNTKGQAGLLPTVSINSGANYSKNNTNLEFAGGIPPAKVDGAQSTSYNASLGVNYTIFNGFARIRTFEKFQYAENMSEMQLRLTIENAVVTTIGLFLDAARLEADIKAVESAIELSNLRVKRAEVSRSLGLSTSLELLSAQVDRQTDSANLLNLQNNVRLIKSQMNFFMGRAIASEFLVEPPTAMVIESSLAELTDAAKQNSTALVLAEIRRNMSELDLDIANANTMPTINLNSSYGFNNAQNGAGIVLKNNNVGFSSGITLSLPIYSGGKVKTAIANAQLQVDRSEMTKAQNSLSIEKEVYDQWYNHQYFTQIIDLETKNIEVAGLNLTKVELAFKQGSITSLELRQAQLNVLSAQNRLNAAIYNREKVAYQLLRLQGRLIND